MKLLVQAFEDEAAPARRLAEALGAPFAAIALHRFPDGEALPTVSGAGETVVVYRSLDRPDAKLMPLLLAAEAWRGAGVRRLVLVAPYLCYLRQDARFRPGQPISRDVIAALIGPRFDRIVTVAPHLHRTRDLATTFGTRATVLSAADALARALSDGETDTPIVIGPDEESEPSAAALAERLEAPHATLRKIRRGDREVALTLPADLDVAGRRVVLADDVCSSGATLAEAARALASRGARHIEAAIAHGLYDEATLAALSAAGVARIVASDSCAHPGPSAPLAQTLAQGLNLDLSGDPDR